MSENKPQCRARILFPESPSRYFQSLSGVVMTGAPCYQDTPKPSILLSWHPSTAKSRWYHQITGKDRETSLNAELEKYGKIITEATEFIDSARGAQGWLGSLAWSKTSSEISKREKDMAPHLRVIRTYMKSLVWIVSKGFDLDTQKSVLSGEFDGEYAERLQWDWVTHIGRFVDEEAEAKSSVAELEKLRLRPLKG